MKYFIWLLTVACAQITWAQPDTLWTRQFGGPADDMINAFCPDGRGGYLAAGECGFNGDEIEPAGVPP